MENTDAFTLALIKAFDCQAKIEVNRCSFCDKKELGCNVAKCNEEELKKMMEA